MDLPFAEEVGHYWKTGQSSPDAIIQDIKKLITAHGGVVTSDMMGSFGGVAGISIDFILDGHTYRFAYPVLPSRDDNVLAARRQCATFMKHDVKAKILASKVLGNRAAFMPFEVLPGGSTAAEVVETGKHLPFLPKLLAPPEDD